MPTGKGALEGIASVRVWVTDQLVPHESPQQVVRSQPRKIASSTSLRVARSGVLTVQSRKKAKACSSLPRRCARAASPAARCPVMEVGRQFLQEFLRPGIAAPSFLATALAG